MNVQRKVLTGESTAFTFDIIGYKFIVKNFSANSVLVNFETITSDNEDTQ